MLNIAHGADGQTNDLREVLMSSINRQQKGSADDDNSDRPGWPKVDEKVVYLIVGCGGQPILQVETQRPNQ